MKDRRTLTAYGLLGVQLLLLAGVFLLPGGDDWTVPRWLTQVAGGLEVLGLLVLGIGLVGLGGSLTPLPIPVAKGRLKVGGIYRFVRHPIYSGLTVLAAGSAIGSASIAVAGAALALVAWLAIKARWEEARLREHYADYAAYAERTPAFIPFLKRAHRP